MPAGTPVEQTAAVLRELGALPGHRARGDRLPGLRRHRGADQLQRPGAPVLPARGGEVGDLQVNLVDKHTASDQSHAIATRVRPALQQIGAALRRQRQGRRSAAGAAGAVADRRRDLRPGGRRRRAGGPGGARGVRRTTGRRRRRRQQHRRRAARRCCWSTGARRRCWACRSRPSWPRCAPAWPARRRPICTTQSKFPAAATLQLPAERQGDLDALLQLAVRSSDGQAGADPRTGDRERHACASSRSITRTCCR